ncbi:Gfo/Idh/MocA family protein [Natrarchaeobius chitinivorans]|uniref:Gfo/Idh/MocA family oxidoreductase n=1 Tax=Natrarchaeobius chitinivorans TaxID=1679083 RepID=A0A3N6M1E2_NATCH|nr:Gfo/Idh/MocA family oxidoreductase [Natrarchaeobius chitinivorans]RQG94164.1 gfo/Idh/MocA family oxidoreductase [Natrarchaeobius chitinivorans]
MPETFSIGLVGAGFRAASHLSSLYTVSEWNYFDCDNAIEYPQWTYDDHAESNPSWVEDVSDLDVSITGVFDPDSDARADAVERCREHGDEPETYNDFDSFLEGEYDGVVVSSPNDVHAEQSIRLLEADVNVLCEKPIAITLEEHDRIIEAVESSDALYYVAFNLRSAPFYMKLKEMVSEGSIGDLGTITCIESRGHFHAKYSFSKEVSGGTLLDKNCHDFDLFNWFAESDPRRVAAFGGQHVFDEDSDVLDHGNVLVEYDDGTKAILDLCMYTPFRQRTRLYEFKGSEGILRSPDGTTDSNSVTSQQATIDLYRQDSRSRINVESPGGGHGGADLIQAKRFLRCLQGKAEPPATVEDAKCADAISLAAEAAVETSEVIHIDDNYDFERPAAIDDDWN